MKLSERACKDCGARMDTVADISPQGDEPGLRAFVCSECGAVDSVLIYPESYLEPEDPTYHGNQR
jgi:hypothetical protein